MVSEGNVTSRRWFLRAGIVLSSLAIISCVSQTADAAAPRVRRYYITQAQYLGGQALTACAKGFHMASLWEILSPSAMQYDTVLGGSAPDSGYGPPDNYQGWVRTGSTSNVSTTDPGISNCALWTSNLRSDYGTRASLVPYWILDPNVVSPWLTGPSPCDTTFLGVWCVENFKGEASPAGAPVP